MSLIILAHPSYDLSIANKTIIDTVKKTVNNIEIRNIHELYSNYKIDVEAEQSALLRHKKIVLQFPLFWFSTPAILKQWFDEVFTYQFAYGLNGDKLKDKHLIISCTIGQGEDAYDGSHETKPYIETFFEWIKHSSLYAQMNYEGAICSYGLSPVLTATESERITKAELHAKKLLNTLLLD